METTLKGTYLITHKFPSQFTVGEQVFHKNNPGQPMKVAMLLRRRVVCSWDTADGVTHHQSFSPHEILQYLYAGIVMMSSDTLCRDAKIISLN
jgi:hypothetical protein